MDAKATQFLLAERTRGVSFDRTATIGRQQLVVTPSWLRRRLRRSGFDVDRRDAERLLSESGGFAESLLRLLGAREVVSVDASDYEGASRTVDLNQPLPADLEEAFTAVVDLGSLEHVFDFPAAVRSCMRMVAVDGHFLSVAPARALPSGPRPAERLSGRADARHRAVVDALVRGPRPGRRRCPRGVPHVPSRRSVRHRPPRRGQRRSGGGGASLPGRPSRVTTCRCGATEPKRTACIPSSVTRPAPWRGRSRACTISRRPPCCRSTGVRSGGSTSPAEAAVIPGSCSAGRSRPRARAPEEDR